MLPSQEVSVKTECRKLSIQAKLSTGLLKSLPANDAKILRNLFADGVEYVTNSLFDEPDAEQKLLKPLALQTVHEGDNDDSGVYSCDYPAENMTKDERERFLFLRLNYCRKRVYDCFEAHGNTRLSQSFLAEVLRWERAALDTRSEIVRENVPLVLAMAKRTRIVGVDLTDLISEGNLALLRAVAKFDCSRGYKFSTYACRAILKSFSRVATRTSRHRGHFPTEFDPDLERGDFLEQRRAAQENDCISELRAMLDGGGAALTDVERTVIRARFAMEHSDDATERAKTLEQVGDLIGVTKERVRQIQNKALAKLRVALEDSVLAQ